MTKLLRTPLPLLCLCAGLLWLSCLPSRCHSIWNTGAVSIDGNPVEFNATMQFSADKGLGVGIKNDSLYLYLCIVTYDQEISQHILHHGLKVYVKPKGKRKSHFGINYPLGMIAQSAVTSLDTDHVTGSLEQLAILGPELNAVLPMKRKVAQSLDIQASALFDKTSMVYELRLRLNSDSTASHAINAATDSLLHISIVSDRPPQQWKPATTANAQQSQSTRPEATTTGAEFTKPTARLDTMDVNKVMQTVEPYQFDIRVTLARKP